MNNEMGKKALTWSLTISVITFVLAVIFSVASTAILNGVTWAIGMVVVFIIVFIGVAFDIVGVAATAANETPFHSMASERVKGARQAIVITRNADRVASFCSDVVGDISGVVSGTAATVVVIELTVNFTGGTGSTIETVISVVFTGIVAATTVGGKAFGKSYAIFYSNKIIFQVGRLIYFIEKKLKLNITGKKRKKQKAKRT